MAKSQNNFYRLADLTHRGYSSGEVRYTLLSGHYHQPLNFTLHSLDAARAALQKLAKFVKALHETAPVERTPSHEWLVAHGRPGLFQSAWTCLLDDLNVPGALGALFSVLNSTKVKELSAEQAKEILEGVHFLLDSLGIMLPPVKSGDDVEAPEEVKALAEQRWTAKQARDFAAADDLRRQIDLAGWIVKDAKDGYTLTPKA